MSFADGVGTLKNGLELNVVMYTQFLLSGLMLDVDWVPLNAGDGFGIE